MQKGSDKKGVIQLAEILHRQGVKYVVFSPGSRNAPLMITFDNDERFTCFVIPDERSAAFYGLGLAEQSKTPVAIMCTSGSALLNYYPAISEAFYRNIPLVIVSADRPKEWIDQGDGQTIRQENVFSNHICGYAELLEHPKDSQEIQQNERAIMNLMTQAKQANGGPVHINFPFEEPLYNQVEITQSELQTQVDTRDVKQFTKEELAELKAIWGNASKKLILCGQMPKNDRLNEQLKRLAAEDKSVAIVVENTSNLQDRNFIHCIDRTIESFLEDNPELYRPDLLITIGGAVISKKVKSYFRKYKPIHNWKVGEAFLEMDTYRSLTKSLPVSGNYFFDCVLDQFEGNQSRFGEQWKQLDYLVREKHDNFLMQAPYSDLSVYNLLLDSVPDFSNLHISNSSTIRYTQLFDSVSTISYFCNRGTSGIDGSVSTAIGNALASSAKLNILITGDMSFFYDSNALWNLHLPTNVRIFLINNSGGGIFDIIPGPKDTLQLDAYFVMNHHFSAEHLCKTFDVNYFKASSLDEIDTQLDVFLEVAENERPGVMEIFTPRETNAQVLAKYFEAIKVKEAPVLTL
ncbi:MAG: 2-succinyl-5-enolpyruvyl-6-hydroxy-3-cyclohexene-1-carboxylic-acid synthase [Brumimicrobium sp.]|nr:2-succinyl-5-enolpyruvyl-6-hydroxy-3-cyclohexene-1-carboxylic-acid synthase [Brumimicrobium sp.]MCO5268202.1 2-succinyl-5-enolpyruvyl-6-hydroxy-3-cyclohexene-1-carboxylic-acid synthase [Brumimicrobium sp.]